VTNNWPVYVASVEAYLPKEASKVLGTMFKDQQKEW